VRGQIAQLPIQGASVIIGELVALIDRFSYRRRSEVFALLVIVSSTPCRNLVAMRSQIAHQPSGFIEIPLDHA